MTWWPTLVLTWQICNSLFFHSHCCSPVVPAASSLHLTDASWHGADVPLVLRGAAGSRPDVRLHGWQQWVDHAPSCASQLQRLHCEVLAVVALSRDGVLNTQEETGPLDARGHSERRIGFKPSGFRTHWAEGCNRCCGAPVVAAVCIRENRDGHVVGGSMRCRPSEVVIHALHVKTKKSSVAADTGASVTFPVCQLAPNSSYFGAAWKHTRYKTMFLMVGSKCIGVMRCTVLCSRTWISTADLAGKVIEGIPKNDPSPRPPAPCCGPRQPEYTPAGCLASSKPFTA